MDPLTLRWWCENVPALLCPRSVASPSPHWSPLSGSWSPHRSWWYSYLRVGTRTQNRIYYENWNGDESWLYIAALVDPRTWKCVVCKSQEETALPHSWGGNTSTGRGLMYSGTTTKNIYTITTLHFWYWQVWKHFFFAPQQSKSFGFAYYILANQEQQHVMTARTRTQKKRKVGDVKLNRSSNLCVNTDLVLQDINTDLTCCTVYKLKASGKQDYTLHTHSDDEGSSRILIDLTSVRQTQGGFLKNSDMKQWNSERNKSNKRWQERTKKKRERDWKWG